MTLNQLRASESQIWIILRGLRKSKSGLTGGIIFATVILAAILAPVISPYDPLQFDSTALLAPPSLLHPLGTDQFGRDILSRIMWGSQASLIVGIVSVGIGLSVGSTIGVFSGYYSGKVDEVLMRVMDMLVSFPAILLGLLIIAILGTGLVNLMIAIGILYIPRFARVTRASFLSEREKEYVDLARLAGDSDMRIAFREILPNTMAPIIVNVTVFFSIAILNEAAFGFLGLGLQPPIPSWGNMLAESRRFLETAPWTTIFPGLAIAITTIGLNLLGDGLRDVLDPRLKLG